MRKSRPIKGSLQRSTSWTKDTENRGGETQKKKDSDEEIDLLLLLEGMTYQTLEMDKIYQD